MKRFKFIESDVSPVDAPRTRFTGEEVVAPRSRPVVMQGVTWEVSMSIEAEVSLDDQAFFDSCESLEAFLESSEVELSFEFLGPEEQFLRREEAEDRILEGILRLLGF